MPPQPIWAPADAAWQPPGGQLLALLPQHALATFLGPPTSERVDAFWAITQARTQGRATLTCYAPSDEALEVHARLRWRDGGGRWRVLQVRGGGLDLHEATFHAAFFALRRFLLGDAAVVGLLLAADRCRLELHPIAPLEARYQVVLELPQLRSRRFLAGQALAAPSRYTWEAVLEPPTHARARTCYMRVRWGPGGMPKFLKSERGRNLPRTGSIRLHRLVAHLRGDELPGHHVHHLNHYGPDNRASNLLTLTPAQHALGLHPEGGGRRYHEAFAPDFLTGVSHARAALDRADDQAGWHTTADAAFEANGMEADDRAAFIHAASLPNRDHLRSDAARNAAAIIGVLTITDHAWTVAELASIISLREGSVRRILARLCGHGLVSIQQGDQNRYSIAERFRRATSR